MRGLMLLAVGTFVLLGTAWAAQGAAHAPPMCSPADMQQAKTLTAGAGPNGSPLYIRACGPGRVVVRLRGKSYAIRGYSGRIRVGGARWLYFGLITSGAVSPDAKGFSIVLEPGDRPGRVNVVDSIVQVARLNLAPGGTAVVAKGLKSGTFALIVTGGRRLTGSWTCG
jgi:hypothetical protein